MLQDPIFLTGLAGIVLALIVMAIFFGRSSQKAGADLPKAEQSTILKDDLAELQRFSCPKCHTVLRQVVRLKHPQRPHQHTLAESGFSPGPASCPKCDLKIQIQSER